MSPVQRRRRPPSAEKGTTARPRAHARTVDRLPDRFYAHLSPGLEEALAGRWDLDSHGRHLKMALVRPDVVRAVPTADVGCLGPGDRIDVEALYAHSYPDNWFDPRMLETGHYFGIREGSGLVCVAGVHVYAPEVGVAALGNITTAPEHRGRGLARAATARLCQALLESVGSVGLNVKADNTPAIRCYEGLGFEVVAEYGEFAAGLRATTAR